jgi:endonuclease YncB( thermonuclease family)
MSTSAAHSDGTWQFDLLDAYAIDGDTARVTVDCGFGAAFRFDLRLAGINAPELRDPGGVEAKRELDRLLTMRPIIVTTHRTATGGDVRSFARWVGSAELVMFDGRKNIGDLLVDEGFAQVLAMK